MLLGAALQIVFAKIQTDYIYPCFNKFRVAAFGLCFCKAKHEYNTNFIQVLLIARHV